MFQARRFVAISTRIPVFRFLPHFTTFPVSRSRAVGNLPGDRLRLAIFDKNRQWSGEMTNGDPHFFKRLINQQTPKILWIGCSDSRVPANQITGLLPGEVFVHRNIANCVSNADLNCLSVIEYAVNLLKVQHIIVCGHYGCGGVAQALANSQIGFLTDNWIRPIRELARYNAKILSKELDPAMRAQKLVEINVQHQVQNVAHTAVVQNAWSTGHALSIHGWVYSINDGLLVNLVEPCVTGMHQVSDEFRIV